jgi:organic radical activating enzyme
MTVEEIMHPIDQTSAPMVVITGGEPLMHDLEPLINALQDKGYAVNIETSGAHRLTGHPDWICLSPKKFKAPLPEVLPLAHELKVVVYNKSDFAWAEEHAAKVSPYCRLYLQPEWSKAAEMTPLIIDYVKANPKWEISLQIHKYINVP